MGFTIHPVVLPELNCVAALGKLEQISFCATTWTEKTWPQVRLVRVHVGCALSQEDVAPCVLCAVTL